MHAAPGWMRSRTLGLAIAREHCIAVMLITWDQSCLHRVTGLLRC